MDFQFKQFLIKQQKAAFKVGTDSVLLGSWAKPENSKQILDIGTGSGVLALMMAQKSNANITALEIDSASWSQAKENAENSPWSERIQMKNISVQEFTEQHSGSFDLIITNPPYFINKAHATGSAVSNARNTDKLSFEDLLNAGMKLLHPEGHFYVVLPTPEAKLFRAIAEKQGFVLSSLLRVQTKPGEKYEKRHLMLFQKTAFLYQEEVLIIESDIHHQHSKEYRDLTRDFYLAF